jgi:hypothetical protein
MPLGNVEADVFEEDRQLDLMARHSGNLFDHQWALSTIGVR